MTDAQIWTVILCLGVGTYLIRYSFLGLIGNRVMPEFMLRVLRYVPVAVLPGLVAPLVLWPEATSGVTEPVRLCAALAALITGALTRRMVPAILAGFAVLAVIPMFLS